MTMDNEICSVETRENIRNIIEKYKSLYSWKYW